MLVILPLFMIGIGAQESVIFYSSGFHDRVWVSVGDWGYGHLPCLEIAYYIKYNYGARSTYRLVVPRYSFPHRVMRVYEQFTIIAL